MNAWWPLLFYKATDAPRFRTGMITMICTCVATLFVTAGVWYFERREHRQREGRTNDDHQINEAEELDQEKARSSEEEGRERDEIKNSS